MYSNFPCVIYGTFQVKKRKNVTSISLAVCSLQPTLFHAVKHLMCNEPGTEIYTGKKDTASTSKKLPLPFRRVGRMNREMPYMIQCVGGVKRRGREVWEVWGGFPEEDTARLPSPTSVFFRYCFLHHWNCLPSLFTFSQRRTA